MPAALTFRVTRIVLPLMLLGTCVSLASSPDRDLISRQSARGATTRRPLSPADIADITQLVMLEDTRHFDADVIGRILKSTHPEVRRRAALSVGRIVDERGRALLVAARRNRVEVIRYLLSMGIPVDSSRRPDRGALEQRRQR